MATVFTLPQMGQTMTEATILKWLKQEGDRIEGWEGIVEMMTDKVNIEVEPQVGGVLRKILAAEGDVILVGAPIAVIADADEDISGVLAGLGSGAAASAAPPAAQAVTATEAATLLSGNGETTTAGQPSAGQTSALIPDELPNVSPRAREAATEGGLPWRTLSLAGTGFEGMVVERDVLAFLQSNPSSPAARPTPLAAKIAAEQGLSLEGLSGSGVGGRIKADDVRRAGGRRAAPAIEAREIPLQGMRKVIAGRLAASYQQAVHVPLRVDVDMTAAGDLRRQLKPALEATGARLTYTDLIAAAVAQALVAYPQLNATLENDVVRIHPGVHLGIAVALDEGLTVPVVRDAHALRISELSLAIQEVAAQARAGSLPPDAYSGGTFTITNLGQFGVDSFDPIINPPQVAILGVGRIQERVVAVAGAATVRPMMTITVSFDHRALDGAPGARFLSYVKELLENPARLLL